MIGNTSCWNCSAVYPITTPKCPQCNASNANVNLDMARARLEERGSDANAPAVPIDVWIDRHASHAAGEQRTAAGQAPETARTGQDPPVTRPDHAAAMLETEWIAQAKKTLDHLGSELQRLAPDVHEVDWREWITAAVNAALAERDDAVRMLAVFGEELCNAGFPAGDRTQTLASIRSALAARGLLAKVLDWWANPRPGRARVPAKDRMDAARLARRIVEGK